MTEWKYKIGQTINNKSSTAIVIDKDIETKTNSKNYKIKRKKYFLLCSECGYEYYKYERYVEDSYCPCCSNKIAVKGINDISTTHSDMLIYFENKEDAYTHTYGSEKYVWCACPICGTKKYIQISHLTSNGICCQVCSDGVSYPEKFVANMLIQLDINFVRQYSKKDADWVGNRFYDFYIPDYNMIIEVNGMQHYKQSFPICDYENQVFVDKEKKQTALQNNISYYIEIDARYSDVDYIKNSILNNEISNIIDVSNVDWTKCNMAGCNSLIKEVCDYWNLCCDKYTTANVAKRFKLDRTTVVSYLKKGALNGWCNYDSRESLLKSLKNNARKIDYDKVENVCSDWNNGLGTKELCKKYNLSQPTVTSYLKYGKDNNICDYSKQESKRRAQTNRALKESKQVNVYKNGVFIMSEINARILAEESLEKLGIKLCRSNISAVCARERGHHHGFIFRYDEDDEFKNKYS